MSRGVEIQNALPPEYIREPVITGAKSVLRKTTHVYNPIEPGSYTSRDGKRIRFLISSTSDILIGKESYFEFKLTITAGGVNALIHDYCFEELGIEAFIRRLDVRAAAQGSLIEDADQYNRYNILMSNLHDTPIKIESLCAASGDSLHPYIGQCKDSLGVRDNQRQYGGVGANTFLADAATGRIVYTGVPQANGALGGNHLQPGHKIILSPRDGAAGDVSVSNVVAVTSNPLVRTELIVTPPPAAGATETSHKMVITDYSPAARNCTPQGTQSKTYTFRLRSEILKKNLPLPLLSAGLLIEMELEDANIALHKITSVNSGTDITFAITEPRFYAVLSTPSPSILEDFIMHFRSEHGLNYHMLQYRYKRLVDTTGAGTFTSQVNIGPRSVRKIYITAVPSSISEGRGAPQRRCASLSTYINSHIDTYQAYIGSKQVPLREVDCGMQPVRAYMHLQNVAEKQLSPFRFPQHHFWPRNEVIVYEGADATAVDELQHENAAKKFIMGFDLSRVSGPAGVLSGDDLSVVTFDVRFTRYADNSATLTTDSKTGVTQMHGRPMPNNVVFHLYAIHDAFLRISSSNITLSK